MLTFGVAKALIEPDLAATNKKMNHACISSDQAPIVKIEDPLSEINPV